ncbi:MAG: ComF family protein [Candidatus Shapirobacteria bacterium]|nr:ComF family protein [Candidatus Shapirobacteria bacterium]
MSFIDLFFPKHCLGCEQEGHYFCSACQKQIKTLEFQICPVCEKPAINGLTHPCCQSRYSLDGLVSLFPYEGIIKNAISKLKYHFVTDLAEELFVLMIRTCLAGRQVTRVEENRFKLLSHLRQDSKVILLPIPLHWRRENWRGFNQSELLGKKLADHFGWQLRNDVLIRQKHTQPQVKLRGDKRQQNIQGAFKISPNIQISQYPNIVIFDDVWTTGSTLNEAGKALKMAGFKSVWGLTICR